MLIIVEENLIQVSDCVCPGYMLVYKCTVMGGGGQFTVWTGTAFGDCSTTNNMLQLSHGNNFKSVKSCDNGYITAEGINIRNGYYTSQLNITVSSRSDLIGRTVVCIHDNGIGNAIIGMEIITSG